MFLKRSFTREIILFAALVSTAAGQTIGNGSGLAASDLYGTGVRLGIYLQALGMIFACIRIKSAGLKLACSALILAILASWSILVARKNISPAEAWVIISIVGLLWIPAGSALLCPTAVVGEGVGTFALMVAMLWNAIAMCLFWSSYYKTLPLLGTSDAAFFFSKVSLKHWFHRFMLAMSILQVLSTFATAMRLERWLRFGSASGILTWALGVTGAELMIKWNDLKPVSDLSLPGQSIPLAIGVTVVVDGIFGLWQPKRKRKYPGLEGVTMSDFRHNYSSEESKSNRRSGLK